MGVLKDFNTSTLTREQAGFDAKRYNTIRPGVSYLGVCTNRACEGNGHTVVCCRGLVEVIVNDDIMSERVLCPCCNQPFKLDTIALFECKATVTVHLREEQRTEFVACGSEIIKFGQRTGGPTIFENGLVTVKAKSHNECVMM